jgi:toxin-antitoxin system PIN domain toxin
MAATLLDVNVLLALFSQEHSNHVAAQRWFKEHEKKGWASCPFTQAAFVRLVSNPSFSRNAASPIEAVSLLEENTQTPYHEFWADNIPYAEAVAPFGLTLSGHQQITDAYLLGLAMHRKGRLATFDRSIAALLPEGKRKADWIVELSTPLH